MRIFKNLAKVSCLSLLLCGVALAGGPVLYVTDLEGRQGNIQEMIKQGDLRLVNGRLDIVDPNAKLVFGGDVNDRGPDSIKLRRWLVDLKERYPNRVALIWGNRDLNKLSLAQALVDLDRQMHQPMKDWLKAKLEKEGVALPADPAALEVLLKKHNTKTNQVLWWTQNNGIRDALELHRKEMEELSGKTATLDQAAADMAASLDPRKGEYFRYLKLGQLAHMDENAFYVHGGVAEENMGIVPGEPEVAKSPKEWEQRLNAWGQAQLDRFRRDLAARKPKNSSKLLVYGDAVWDPTVNQVMAMNQSVVYPYRVKEEGNFRLPSQKVVDWLKKGGVKTVVVGHSPVGNVPVPLRDEGFLYLHADTSYTANGVHTTVVLKDGEARVRGMTADGTLLDYKVSADGRSPVGFRQGDHVVVGATPDGKPVLYRYYDGYKIEEKLVPAGSLKAADLSVPRAAVNDEVVKQAKTVREAVQAKGKPVLQAVEELETLYPGRTPVLFSGASKLSFDDGSEKKVREMVLQAFAAMDKEKTLIVTGGTDYGVEKIVHEEAKRLGIPTVGFSSVQSAPAGFNLVDRVYFAGSDWDSPLQRALEYVKAKNGQAIFMGGGGVVKRGIEYAEKLGARMALMENLAGASADAAPRLPDSRFRSGVQLQARMRANGAPLRVGVYTGSFDPPHAGHQKIVEEMKRRYKLDKIYVVPDKIVAYKPGMQPLAEREEMVRRMFAGQSGIEILPANLTGSGEIWDVLKAAQARDPGAAVHAIMGTDTFEWLRKLPKTAQVPGVSYLVNQRDASVRLPTRLGNSSVRTVDLGDEGYSSSQVRATLAQGKQPPELPAAVYDYVKDKGLYQAAAPTAAAPKTVVSKESLVKKAEEAKPPKQLFVKDAPVLAFRIKSDKFEDLPQEIRQHLGAVDQTKYTPEYLGKNIGSVIALQMNGDKPDFYVIGKDTFESKYAAAPFADVAKKNGKYFGKLGAQVPGLTNGKNPDVLAVLKTVPTEMVRASDLGYALDKNLTIESPWGEQTKPAGQDAFLVWDDAKKQFYMVNTGADGLPLSYVPAKPATNAVVSKESLVKKAEEAKPPKQLFVKDAPVLAYRIKSDKFEDLPAEIRQHLGAVDQTKYTPEYLGKNIGSVIALQMNGDKPDFYVIGKDTFESKYAAAPFADVAKKNGKYFGKLAGEAPGLTNGKNPDVLAVLKTVPTEMVRASDLGYALDKNLTIESPWGEQTKPAGQDAFLVWDDAKKQFYMVNTGADGLPLSYVPAKPAATAAPSRAVATARFSHAGQRAESTELVESQAVLASKMAAVKAAEYTHAQVRRHELKRNPPKYQFVKDAPLLGYRIQSDRFEDIPDSIRRHLGEVGKTTYTREYLRENIGSVIALQMNGDTPDFYIVGKDTFAQKYGEVSKGELKKKSAAYLERLKAHLPASSSLAENGLVAMLRTVPSEMVKMSEFGFRVDREVRIKAPWGVQTKPAGVDAFLNWDEANQQYYMVVAGPDGNPVNYVPARALAGKRRVLTPHFSCEDLYGRVLAPSLLRK